MEFRLYDQYYLKVTAEMVSNFIQITKVEKATN